VLLGVTVRWCSPFVTWDLARFGRLFRALLFPMRFPNASRGRWRALSPLQLLMLPNQYPLIGEQRVHLPSGSGRARSGRRKLDFGTLAGLTAAASESGRSNAAAEGGLRLSDKTREVQGPAEPQVPVAARPPSCRSSRPHQTQTATIVLVFI